MVECKLCGAEPEDKNDLFTCEECSEVCCINCRDDKSDGNVCESCAFDTLKHERINDDDYDGETLADDDDEDDDYTEDD